LLSPASNDAIRQYWSSLFLKHLILQFPIGQGQSCPMMDCVCFFACR
jgi:hypothetical protein